MKDFAAGKTFSYKAVATGGVGCRLRCGHRKLHYLGHLGPGIIDFYEL